MNLQQGPWPKDPTKGGGSIRPLDGHQEGREVEAEDGAPRPAADSDSKARSSSPCVTAPSADASAQFREDQIEASEERDSAPPRDDRADSVEPATRDDLDPGREPPHIVGIGASAGGLEALETFFDHMPHDSGMAFVVVQHLSPDFKSVMDELLARHTHMPIHRVENGMAVEANAVYLIPPRKEMIISDGKLLLSDKDPGGGLTLPIDIFLRSLAQDAGARAIAVILSGTGSDGSRGICDIHAAGGLAVAQDPDCSKFAGMPTSAIETGMVEAVLPPERIPLALLSYVKHPCSGEMSDFTRQDPALLEGFDAIFQLLRKSYGIDFSHYKRTTVARRVQRRLLMSQITDLEKYVERLRGDANELNSLYKDLLIGVTKFFRDAEAFEAIAREALPGLIERARKKGELRAWVAGCATGEEAYSLAIAVQEALERIEEPIEVKIFATDVHRASLECASAGVYSEASLFQLSSARRERYFTRVKNGFQVSQELRKMIVFAPHNLIKDSPFTKLDLVTCRNLLIYFESLAQKKVLSLFHFALSTGGVLVLGPSESTGDLADEFDIIDDRWRIYRKRRDRRLPAEMRAPLSVGFPQPRIGRGLGLVSSVPPPPSGALLKAYDALLEEHAPPSLLVNERRELVQSFGGAAEYLRFRDGRLTADVLDLIMPELKAPLATALQQAASKQRDMSLRGIRVAHAGEERRVTLSVKPLPTRHGEDGHFLVTFANLAPPPPRVEEEGVDLDMRQASRDQLAALENELRFTKENLQSTVEEIETSNEELQATNEELVASNEELQSTNEELHSVNEELYTVNAEYQKKIGELTELTADLDNLLHSTDVGVIFLDRELCIRKFTAKSAKMFHLLPHDIGRPMSVFAHHVGRPELLADVRGVIESQTTFETEFDDGAGTTQLLRILPYRAKGRIEGAVLTLIDITRLKHTERELRLMSKVFQDGADPIVIEDLEGRVIDLNSEAERSFGWSKSDLVGQPSLLMVPEEDAERSRELRRRCREKGGLRNLEAQVRCKDGQTRPVLKTLSLLNDERGRPVAIARSTKDIADRKRAEEMARDAVRRRDHFLAMLSHELRNPLGAVLNATYVFDHESDGALPPRLAEAACVIQRQSLQVARLLDDLLDVSRLTQGKIEVRREPVDLTTLVTDAVQAVRPVIEARGHKLSLAIWPSPLVVDGDAARLLQVQENLLTNAAKYTPPNGHIHLSIEREGEEAVIRVRDDGKGIPSHLLEAIFDMFVQSDDTLDRADGGMGLGLTLVKALVSMHGGRISAHSDGANRGSEFVVRLPLLADTAAKPRAKSNTPAKPVARHILIVEDNADSRKMLEALLKLDGHRVSVAEDGQQGLEAILRQRPDVAIVDIGLPRLNGYEVAKRVRQSTDHHICLVALTGYGRPEDRDAVLRAGFDTHLVKPLKPKELARILEELGQDKRPEAAS